MKKLSMIFCFALVLMAQIAMAQMKYDIKEITPEVKSALDGRRARFDQLRAFKQQGVVGENNKGYVQFVGASDEAIVQPVVNAENKDRKLIYQAIVQQNNLPADALSTIEEVFAQVQREKASSGEKIQQADGQWTVK